MSTPRHGWRYKFLVIIFYTYVNISPCESTKFKSKWGAPVNPCLPNSYNLLNLVNLACSNAQPLNTTVRDACYGCFARFITLPPDDSQLLALTLCAATYFTATLYDSCVIALADSSTAIISSINACNSPYCQFVQCIRAVNSNSVVIQCSREVLATTLINITTDIGGVTYFSNMTSCILAKIRCSVYNPITGEPQLPGILSVNGVASQVALYNSLQITRDGTLRVISIPSTVAYPPVFCSAQNTFAQSNWLNNACP